MSHFRLGNMNPWGRLIGDCAVRAVSAALAMRYDAVCGLFGKKCQPGRGLVGNEGICLETVKRRLGRFFDKIEDAGETAFEARPPEFAGMEFDPAFDESPDLGLSLDEFCDAYTGTGRYLVAVVPPEVYAGRNSRGHMTYADLRPGRGVFMDTWDCGRKTVLAFMRVKAVLSFKDPRSLYFGKKTGA